MRNRKWLSLTLLFVGLATSLVVISSVAADVAPNPIAGAGGRGVEPATVTNVQMVSETVLMEIGDFPFTLFFSEETFLGARVTADFLFHNPNSQGESLPVGFPLYLWQTPPQIDFEEIWRLRAYINGVEVTTTKITVQSVPWAVWDMVFPPGETSVRVTYDVPLPAPRYSSLSAAHYVLHTGAGWAGPIGQGEIVVRFPYVAEPTFFASGEMPPGYAIDGVDVRWHFENLEPTVDDDFAFGFIDPNFWREVARARQAVNTDRSADNYRNLARAYTRPLGDPAFFVYPNNPLLAQTAEAQYLKAIELDPNNRDLRQEFAEFVTTWEGLLLPDNESLVLTQIASTPIATASRLPTSANTATAPPATRASATLAATASEAATAIAQAATDTPAPVINAPTSQAPTITPTTRGSSSPINFTPWLIGALIIVIIIGLGIALRKPAK